MTLASEENEGRGMLDTLTDRAEKPKYDFITEKTVGGCNQSNSWFHAFISWSLIWERYLLVPDNINNIYFMWWNIFC